MSADPRRAFVIGHPIAHSRSPLIHGHWLSTLGIAGSYERIDVSPSGLSDFMTLLPHVGFAGGNVTIPHKEDAARLCTTLDASAERLGAANTLVVHEDGTVEGRNTDGVGFIANCDATLGPGWDGGRGLAVLIGAGGAARAIAGALLDRGFDLAVVNRTPERAEGIRRFAPGRVAVHGPDALGGHLRDASLLVNTTSLGMAGQPPLVLDLATLPERAVVSDIVYVPAETALLADARARGLRTVGGLGMLLHQAVPGFRAWFGATPAVTPELHGLVEADIAAGAR